MKLLTHARTRFLIAVLALQMLATAVQGQQPAEAKTEIEAEVASSLVKNKLPSLPATLATLKTVAPKAFDFDSPASHNHPSRKSFDWWLVYQPLPVRITGVTEQGFTVAFSTDGGYEPKGDIFTIVREDPYPTKFYDRRGGKLEAKSEKFFMKELKENPDSQWLITFDRRCGRAIEISREKDPAPPSQPQSLSAEDVNRIMEEYRLKNYRIMHPPLKKY